MTETNKGFQSMLTCKEAATYVGIRLDRFREWLKGGREKIPHYRVGKRSLFKEEDLDSWVERHRKL